MLEIYSRWWCLDPKDYDIFFKKGSIEDIYTLYHFMDTLSKAIFDDASLIPFAKVISNMPIVERLKSRRKEVSHLGSTEISRKTRAS